MKQSLRKYFLPIIAFLTAGCNNRFVNCYQCYMGNMFVSSASLPYSSLSQKEIGNGTLTTDKTYHGNIYVLANSQEASAFLSSESITISNEEKTKNSTLDESSFLVYFFVQIPSGYRAYKRDNIQASLPGSQETVLLTDNFYFYANRTDLFYCQVDIKKDESMTAYVYSFYYDLSTEYLNDIQADHIRILYSLAQQD